MKKNYLTLLACLAFCGCLFAHNGDPDSPKGNDSATSSETGFSLKDIFLSDYDGVTMYIDFQAVKDVVVDVNVFQNKKTILHDNVADLPSNTIYEVDLSELEAGDYLIEIMTDQGIHIQKEMTIN